MSHHGETIMETKLGIRLRHNRLARIVADKEGFTVSDKNIKCLTSMRCSTDICQTGYSTFYKTTGCFKCDPFSA